MAVTHTLPSPSAAEQLPDDQLLKRLFVVPQEVLDSLLGVLCALDGERYIHVHEKPFVFKAHELAVVQRARSAEGELDRALRRLRGGKQA
jgi:hypothetical protein